MIMVIFAVSPRGFVEVDLGVCGIGLSYERHKDFSFSSLYLYDKVTFYLRSPRVKPKITAFLYSFSLTLWICILLSLPITSFIVYLLSKYYFKSHRKEQSFFSILWSLFSSLIYQESSNYLWILTPFRLIFGVWLIYSLIITSSYSGTLVSLLTLPSYEYYPRNFIQLAEACRLNLYECGAVRSQIVHQKIMNGQTDLEKSLALSMIRNKENEVETLQEGFERVLKRNFAIIIPKGVTQNYVAQFGDDVVTSDDFLYGLYAGMVFHKNSSFGERLNNIINRLLATGILQKWMEDDFATRINHRKDIEDHVIKMEQLQVDPPITWRKNCSSIRKK
ncbi:glutamate receptor ionotropic, delta-2-like [Centruroides sculpturatus]|uniref:glutamate receptor ionotropic, delta-2-like n=1 Tax=Centruroides sculpturatus TaxID=218467 RepID=UPI000C6E6388|nr:glutamate receptor ionotropic, delta-2-like [Centruroides sculpturatus]